MFGIRVLTFVLSLLVAAQVLEPEWEVFAILLVLGSISIRDAYGLAYVVAVSVLLAQAPDVSEAMTVIAAVLAGLAVLMHAWPFRWRPWSRADMIGVRVLLFVPTVLAAAEVLEADWQLFALLVVLGVISIRDVYGVAYVVAASVALIQAPDPSEGVLIVAALLAGFSAFLPLLGSTADWFGRPPDLSRARQPSWPPQPRFRLRPGAIRRIRRWAEARD